MKSFFENYGFVILSAIVVIILIAMAGPIGNTIQNSISNIVEGFKNKTETRLNTIEDGDYIDKNTSYVGYYADTNGDGTVDGVIFADLAIGGSGVWNESGDPTYDKDGVYSYNPFPKEQLKDYEISLKEYSDKFGKKPVLKVAGSEKDRFYIMALKDISNHTYTWYASAYNANNGLMTNWQTTTSRNFGSG